MGGLMCCAESSKCNYIYFQQLSLPMILLFTLTILFINIFVVVDIDTT